MSNCFWACEECGHLWSTTEYQERCTACTSPRIWFDSELEAQDHVEVWPVNDDTAIIIEKGDGGDDDEGPTLQ